MSGPPYPPPAAAGANGIGLFEIGVGSVGVIGDIKPFDWFKTVISQYANSQILVQLIENFDHYVDQTKNFDAFFDMIWNVDTAQGYGLDVWGRIVGVNRVLEISNPNYFGFAEAQVGSQPFNQAPFYSGELLTDNFALSDQSFRLLIFAKALANITDGSIPSINQILLNLFPGRGNCYVSIPQPTPYWGFAEALQTQPNYVRGWNDANLSLAGYFGFAEASPGSEPFGQGAFYSLYFETQNPTKDQLYAPFYSGQHIPHMELEYVFDFPLTAVEMTIVQSSGVLPTPVAVLASVVTP